ncbi:MAG: acyl-[acyl-carrier-protein] thioesterase [Lachnospiraceae bacterium]|nr:acyl-[acyl-carrier-protein] thioesterase [Lachnospiraceae bacterium]
MYEYQKRIGFSECDTTKHLTITALVDAFQDCSTFQSEDLGVGFDVLERQHLVWVINYWEIQIDSLPQLCDHVTVGTFPYSFKTCFGQRNFYMKDREGRYLVKANSMWTLIDSETVKPTRTPSFISEAYTIEPKLDMSYNSRKVLIPSDEGLAVIRKDPIRIQEHHLDSNRHVNNGQYVKIAMAQIEDHNLDRLRIDYRKQAVLGDIIYPVVYENGSERVVALEDENKEPYSVSQYILKQ